MPKAWLNRLAHGIRLGLVATFAMASIACTSRTPEARTAVVFDSAGIRVIDLGADPERSAIRRVLAGEPDLVIRSSEDDDGPALFDVRDVQPIPGGRIAVANGGTNQILVFDDSGHLVATWGGFGEGPGEFRRLQWLTLKPPDTLAAGDYGARRVTLLAPDGRFARDLGTESAVGQSSSPIPPQPMGLLRNGALVAATYSGPASEEGTVRPTVELFVIPPDRSTPGNTAGQSVRRTVGDIGGNAVRTVGTWPGDEISLHAEQGQLQVFNTPFGRRLHIETSAEGIWIADDARWELHEYSARGRLVAVVRSSVRPAAVTDPLFEEYLGHKYRGLPEGPGLEELKQLQRAVAFHTTAPGFGRIRAIPGSGLAVGDFATGASDTQRWFTVETNGVVATLEIPVAFDVMRWGNDWILVVVRDALDREEIHRYQILDAG